MPAGRRRVARGEPPLWEGIEGLDPAPPPPLAAGTSGPRAGVARSFVVRTDGAARGNPGPASVGVVLVDAARPDAADPAASPDATISAYLGRQTNNVAEYTAVVRALELALRLGAAEVHLLLDSKLIVEQLAGRWRVKDPKLTPIHAQARALLGGVRRWTARHVPRAQNAAADALANEAIDRVAAGGPAAVEWVADPFRPAPELR